MDETVARISGRLVGGQKLVDIVTHVFEKTSDVLDHASDVFGDLQDYLKARTITLVLEHKYQSDDEYQKWKKKAELQRFRFECSDLDRSRTKLEREIKELRARKEKLIRELRNPGSSKPSMKAGTVEVTEARGADVQRERKPLTHRMDINPVIQPPAESSETGS